MSSVNGNAMQYSAFQSSPELFPPVGSVYCAAPNTAASVNTRRYREPSMSFSQCHSEQTASGQVSEADSGIDRSESGRSRGDSRLQRAELREGQSSVMNSTSPNFDTVN